MVKEERGQPAIEGKGSLHLPINRPHYFSFKAHHLNLPLLSLESISILVVLALFLSVLEVLL
jgi:hypothetical protein